jgi:two-component system, NarL family, nitrate/nitrite response regulator NarL
MATRKRIYVVEDDPLTSSLICTMLGKNPKMEVIPFDEGTQALEACRKQIPDVLIIDYQLPGMTGIDLFDTLKADLPESTVVIMASAIDDGTLVLKFIQKGIRNYVMKDSNLVKSIQDIIEEELK